jgi:phosphate transport system permease protein
MSKNHQLLAKKKIKRRKAADLVFAGIALLTIFCALLTLLALVLDLAMTGVPRIDFDFMSRFPSRIPENSGILSAWVGSIAVMLVTAGIAIPLGVAAGVYLEEYAPKNWVTMLIELNITNLAGVPSIIYGLMALGLLVYKLQLGQSIQTAGLTLGLLVLPIVIVTTRESIRAIPNTLREAAYAMGASRWQVMQHHVLPYSTGGILTGVIIALSRAIGETAPLITIGALTFIAFLPTAPVSGAFPYLNLQFLSDPFTVLPIQMFNWVSRPQSEFHVNAAATGVVLLGLTLVMNCAAILVRYKIRKSARW